MNANVRDCLVMDYESLIPTLSLPDSEDRQVLAAAICCGADTIVTYNLRDFPASALVQHGIEAQHPDVFIMRLLDISTEGICAAIQRQRTSLRNPPHTVDELLATLEQQSLMQTAARLRGFMSLL